MRKNSCKVVGQLKTTWEELVNIVLFDSCVLLFRRQHYVAMVTR